MGAGTVLVVEDNPITRKMLRLTLESDGYEVVPAGDGSGALAAAAGAALDLAVIDYVLPDMDGLSLLAELRRAGAQPELPALLVTGMSSRLEELTERGGPLVQVLIKPLEPSRLLEVVSAHLGTHGSPGCGRRVLVIDDEPLNLKLAALRLRNAGYEVETATSGEAGLEVARRWEPQAILADVLMPGMDGFSLCLAVRSDPRLAAVPVVLASSSYVEDPDRQLAAQVGASALVLRTGDLGEAAAALARSLGAAGVPVAHPGEDVVLLHRERLQAQVEREKMRNDLLVREAAIQATALSVIRGLSEALSRPQDVPGTIGDVLIHSLDATGLSTGLFYRAEPDGSLQLQALFGIASEMRADAKACFGQPELLQDAMSSGASVGFAERGRPSEAQRRFLARIEQSSALLVPFVVLGRRFGLLVLASDSHDLDEVPWQAFARSLASQLGQTVALVESLQRLGASEARLRALMEQANDAIFVVQRPNRVIEANREAERILGRPREEIIGRTYDELVVPEERALLEGERRVLASEGALRVVDRHLLRSDGTRVPVEVSVSLAHVDGPGSDPVLIAIMHDLTERRRLETQLLQAQRMESMGRLAGGVAHDFNNMLGVISGYGELLRERLSADPQLQGFADEVLKAGARAAGLTRQLLAFSRRQVLQPRILDVNRVVADIETMLRRVIGEDVELVTAVAERLPAIEADPGQLEQVLLNLAVNARDAMPRGGRLTLATRAVEAGGELDATRAVALGPGPHVVLAVSDTGIGMPPEVQVHLFEPFYTTKGEGRGTGLGLATAHGIVEQSGGRIFVSSEEGRGSTFEVYLPVVEGRPSSAAPAPRVELPRGAETVLVVEDEAALRPLIRRFLDACGYDILEAGDAAAALEVAASFAGVIHLLLTDVVMPGCSGIELAAQMVARRPGIRVLYMSGYTDDEVILRGALTDDVPLLEKPFTVGILARKVREVLDR